MITIMFSCAGCGLVKHKLQVPARETEDIFEWMEKVKRWLGDEHERVSPQCQSPCCDLMIPMPDDAEFIGQQTE